MTENHEPLLDNPDNTTRDHKPLGKFTCGTIGVSWGVATFEGGNAIYHFLFNNDKIADYTISNQALGLFLFTVVGGGLFGRFVYKEDRKIS